jgi:hypothetical protein
MTKPFDLELAKKGHTVETSDGRKARIICFDCKDGYPLKNPYPLIVLITNICLETGRQWESICYANKEGNFYELNIKSFCLKMSSIKNKGWINIHNIAFDTSNERSVASTIYSTKEEALNYSYNDHIATIEIEWEE